jgi:hypothetical protein
MGRTIPTVNQVLEQNREQWARFYRALRKEDRALLDELFDGAKYFTAACVYQINAVPSESIFMAMLLHLQKEVREIKRLAGRPDQSGSTDGAPTEPKKGAGLWLDTGPVSRRQRHGRVDDRAGRRATLLLG